jgi:hypothetical protein
MAAATASSERAGGFARNQSRVPRPAIAATTEAVAMDIAEAVLKLGQLAVAVASAFGVTWYWNRTKHHHDEFRLLEEGYGRLLKLYFDNPQFGDPERTADFERSFQDADRLRYHYFAMTVHTLMETIHDLSHCRGKMWREWQHIFFYHSRLHAAWLAKHQALHEPRYVARVLGPPAPVPK